MNDELVIKKLDVIPTVKTYIAQCIIVHGKVLTNQNESWYLKSNPKLKITFISPVITKTKIGDIDQEKYLLDFTIEQPEFDLTIFNKPTSWIKK